MKIFTIKRTPGGVCCTVDTVDEEDAPPPRRLRHTRRHSPTGFEFGYGGSGPAELALAIVRNILRDRDPDPRLYQSVKWKLIAPLRGDGPHVLTEANVRRAMGQFVSRRFDPDLGEA